MGINLSLDRGIIERVQLSQIPFTIIHVRFNEPETIFLNQQTDTINIRLSYRDNIPVNLNGVETSFLIEV